MGRVVWQMAGRREMTYRLRPLVPAHPDMLTQGSDTPGTNGVPRHARRPRAERRLRYR
jgi:hypothetical protein